MVLQRERVAEGLFVPGGNKVCVSLASLFLSRGRNMLLAASFFRNRLKGTMSQLKNRVLVEAKKYELNTK